MRKRQQLLLKPSCNTGKARFRLLPATIYRLKLLRRGHIVSRGLQAGWADCTVRMSWGNMDRQVAAVIRYMGKLTG